MKFCSLCAHPVELKNLDGDHLPRFVCTHCQTVHYQNPRLITGTLPIAPDGRILMCKRNIEPQKGLWTLPAGFMENNETTVEGALRETREEACVCALNPELISIISVPAWNQVHLFYRVDMPDFSFQTTRESEEVALFDAHEIPWHNIAFKTVSQTLNHYLEHRRHESSAKSVTEIPVLNSAIAR